MRAILQKKASFFQEEEARVLVGQIFPRWAGRAGVDEGHRRLMVIELPALDDQ